jgi:alpha-D-ribose 1-methylphosphonate 5-phosphate C-P lyase
MPLPYGWGTGGIQVTASMLGPDDVLKVIDQGADDTTNAVSIRRFFARTAGVRDDRRATVEATRDPDAPPHSRSSR